MDNLKITFFEEVDDLDGVSIFKCVECKSLWKLRMKDDYKYCPNCGRTVATRDVYNKYIVYLNSSMRTKQLYDEIVNAVR